MVASCCELEELKDIASLDMKVALKRRAATKGDALNAMVTAFW
jgi:hypothetical protein